ncbi:9854_t:CDS:1, partial [Entrophospora sp. SA101]
MNNQVYRTPEGLTEEIAIKAALNLWLTEKLKAAFPSIVPITRPTCSPVEKKNHMQISKFFRKTLKDGGKGKKKA